MRWKVSWRATPPGTCKLLVWCSELSTRELIREHIWPPKLCNKKGSVGKIYGDPPFKSLKDNRLFLILWSILINSALGCLKLLSVHLHEQEIGSKKGKYFLTHNSIVIQEQIAQEEQLACYTFKVLGPCYKNEIADHITIEVQQQTNDPRNLSRWVLLAILDGLHNKARKISTTDQNAARSRESQLNPDGAQSEQNTTSRNRARRGLPLPPPRIKKAKEKEPLY